MRAKRIKVGDLSGMRFGRLTVTSEAAGNSRRWRCACDCGEKRLVTSASLLGGQRSCGCLSREDARRKRTVHGLAGTRTYGIWQHMKRRCYHSGDISFIYYGARGVTVCDRWNTSFSDFLADMGECPHGMSIDRIDNSGNYEPANCKWSTRTEQNINKRRHGTASRIDQSGQRVPILLAKSKPTGKVA